MSIPEGLEKGRGFAEIKAPREELRGLGEGEEGREGRE